jgi:hypothetical protein
MPQALEIVEAELKLTIYAGAVHRGGAFAGSGNSKCSGRIPASVMVHHRFQKVATFSATVYGTRDQGRVCISLLYRLARLFWVSPLF